jgi:hypothetical protein
MATQTNSYRPMRQPSSLDGPFIHESEADLTPSVLLAMMRLKTLLPSNEKWDQMKSPSRVGVAAVVTFFFVAVLSPTQRVGAQSAAITYPLSPADSSQFPIPNYTITFNADGSRETHALYTDLTPGTNFAIAVAVNETTLTYTTTTLDPITFIPLESTIPNPDPDASALSILPSRTTSGLPKLEEPWKRQGASMQGANCQPGTPEYTTAKVQVQMATREPAFKEVGGHTNLLRWRLKCRNQGQTATVQWRNHFGSCFATSPVNLPPPLNTNWFLDFCNFTQPAVNQNGDGVSHFVHSGYHNFDFGDHNQITNADDKSTIIGRTNLKFDVQIDHKDSGEGAILLFDLHGVASEIEPL